MQFHPSSLIIERSGVSLIRQGTFLPVAFRLRTLALPVNQMKEIDPVLFSELQRLEKLDLSREFLFIFLQSDFDWRATLVTLKNALDNWRIILFRQQVVGPHSIFALYNERCNWTESGRQRDLIYRRLLICLPSQTEETHSRWKQDRIDHEASLFATVLYFRNKILNPTISARHSRAFPTWRSSICLEMRFDPSIWMLSLIWNNLSGWIWERIDCLLLSWEDSPHSNGSFSTITRSMHWRRSPSGTVSYCSYRQLTFPVHWGTVVGDS